MYIALLCFDCCAPLLLLLLLLLLLQLPTNVKYCSDANFISECKYATIFYLLDWIPFEEKKKKKEASFSIFFSAIWILAIKVEQNFWLKGLIKTNQPYLQTIKFSANLSYFILKPDFTVNQPRSELGDNMAQLSWCNWYRNSYTNVNAFTTGPNPTNNVTKWCY